MNKQIERILICILWLLAATLGTCFWLNTVFGFNIFSAQHWQYLAYLQAAQQPVRTSFYVSLTAAAVFSVVVLYVLMRPADALRRLHGIRRRARKTPNEKQQTKSAPAPENNAATAPTPTPAQTTAPPPAAHVQAPPRPMRPVLSAAPRPAAAPATAPQNAQPAPTRSDDDFTEIRDIFRDAGYVVKRSPQIGNFKPALLAIGAQETLWMGGVGIGEKPIADAMERLSSLFSDTLDDIEISIHGFIVAPTAPTDNPDIMTFRDVAELREYIGAHKNTPPADSGEKENFNAYSEYIDTVITYMDKT